MENKVKYIQIILLTIFITSITLFAVNYFTVFGYYLPHKPQMIFMERGDISVHFRPMFLSVSGNTSNLYVIDENPELLEGHNAKP